MDDNNMRTWISKRSQRNKPVEAPPPKIKSCILHRSDITASQQENINLRNNRTADGGGKVASVTS